MAGVDDRDLARLVAAEVGLPGVPVSMRADPDAPGTGVGTGHWLHHVERLRAAQERAAVAVAGVPVGGVRDQLDRLLGVLDRRTARYVHIAEVGQALVPDDDTTDADGTVPGERPRLDGAAAEIDARLATALRHLAAVAAAVEAIALAAVGDREPEQVAAQLDELFRTIPNA